MDPIGYGFQVVRVTKSYGIVSGTLASKLILKKQFGGWHTLPETNSSHPKMDGWKTIVSFWTPAYFSGGNC